MKAKSRHGKGGGNGGGNDGGNGFAGRNLIARAAAAKSAAKGRSRAPVISKAKSLSPQVIVGGGGGKAGR